MPALEELQHLNSNFPHEGRLAPIERKTWLTTRTSRNFLQRIERGP